jgi:hypothetical protein
MPAVAVVPSTKVPAVRTKERQALASALAAQVALQALLEEALLAQRASQDGASRARRELDEMARRPPERASSPADLIASVAAGHPPAAPPAAPTKEVELAVLSNVLDQWRLALAASEKAIPLRRAAVDSAAERVRGAALAVVIAESNFEAVLQRAEQLQKSLIADRLLLRFIAAHLPTDQRSRVARYLQDTAIPADPFMGEPSSPDWDRHPICAALRSTVTALATNPDAPLPDARDV